MFRFIVVFKHSGSMISFKMIERSLALLLSPILLFNTKKTKKKIHVGRFKKQSFITNDDVIMSNATITLMIINCVLDCSLLQNCYKENWIN